MKKIICNICGDSEFAVDEFRFTRQNSFTLRITHPHDFHLCIKCLREVVNYDPFEGYTE